MKTDYERTKEFLDSLGITYGADERNITFGNNKYSDDDFPECNKVTGYPGFYASFMFDDSGAFITVGIGE
jgi:hypothetical protein